MPEQTLKQKTAKDLFWGGLSNGGQQILNLVFGLVLARILNAEDYGMVGMLAIVLAAYPLGIYPMVVCYIGAYYLLLLFWHCQCSRLVGITFWQICRDILPYAGGMALLIAVSYGIVSLMEYNRFAVLAVKIVSVAFLYLSMMWLSNSVIFKEMVAYLRGKKE